MNARIPQSRNCAAALSWGWQWGCGGIETGSRQRPDNAPANRVASTKRVSGRHLTTLDEIVAAVDRRLDDWPPQMIDDWIEALRVVADDFRDDRPEVEIILADIQAGNPGRHPWPTACALLACDALRRGDVVLAMSAGVEVLAAEIQARRASNPRGGDALEDLIRPYVIEGFLPNEIWRDLCRQAEDGSGSAALDEYDPDRAVLRFQATPHDNELSEIGYRAFRKRVQRLREKVAESKDFSSHG